MYKEYVVRNCSSTWIDLILQCCKHGEQLQKMSFWVDFEPEEQSGYTEIRLLTKFVRLDALNGPFYTELGKRQETVILGFGVLKENTKEGIHLGSVQGAVLRFNPDKIGDGTGTITFYPSEHFDVTVRPRMPEIEYFENAVFTVLSVFDSCSKDKTETHWNRDTFVGNMFCDWKSKGLIKRDVQDLFNVMKEYGLLEQVGKTGLFIPSMSLQDFETIYRVRIPRP